MTARFLRMPRLGETMEEGKIVGWLIAPGDSFRRGDPIIEIETDKTIAEFPALGDGRLEEILVEIGDTLPVGAPLARIDIGAGPDWTAEEGEAADPATPAAPQDKSQPEGLVEVDLLMPRLGETMDEGRVAKWLKAPGEDFARGEAIIEIETDKTVAEYPSLQAGRLVSILRGDGDMVPVGEPIARIAVSAASVEAQEPSAAPTEAPKPAQLSETVALQPDRSAPADGRLRATPVARRLARRNGIDLTQVSGTGRRGRIEKADVLQAASPGRPSNQGPGDVLFADLKRGRMAYLDSGAGDGLPVLLLHGFSGDRTTWAGITAGLRRAGRRVIVPDLPGHGLTAIPATGPEDLSADLPELLDGIKATQVEVVAHSLGAVAALALAKPAGRVRSLTLIAPAGIGLDIDGHFIRGMAHARTGGEVAHLLRRLSINGVSLSSEAIDALAADLARGRLVALADAISGPSGQKVDSLAAIETVSQTVPVRVLVGTEDRIIPWQQILGLPPRVAVHILSRSGHMPQWDQSRDVLDILLAGRPDHA